MHHSANSLVNASGMDYRKIFPAPVFTIHRITVPHSEIIQVDEQRGVVY
jgi:hypothetical protein